MMQPGSVPFGYVAFATLVYLIVLTLLLVIPAALLLIPISAAAGALGTIGIVVASLIGGDAKLEMPADDGSAPDPARNAAGVDPAWPHYLAGQAVNDADAAANAVLSAVGGMWRGIRSFSDRFARADPRTQALLGPLMVLPYTAGAAASLGVGLSALVISVITGGAAAVLWATRCSGVTLMRLVDRMQLSRAGAGATCTVHGCFEYTQLPTVECDCGRLHIRLQPGHYGVVRRKCTCGKTIPSTVARAASSLKLRCPWCRRQLLPGAMLDTDVRVAVIGASGAGKTTFVDDALSAVGTAVAGAGGSVNVLGFGEANKDGARCTSARVVLGRRHGTLHLFDAPGRILDDQLQRIQLRYLRDAQGFALVIDPVAVPWLAARFQDPPRRDFKAVDPELTYRAVIAQLRDGGMQLRRRSLAVVLNRADLLEDLFDSRGSEPGSRQIRNWLSAHGQDNLVKAADRDFGSVRYFLTTSVGNESASAGAALRWLAGRSGLPLPSIESDTAA
jgi:hypothetical protein